MDPNPNPITVGKEQLDRNKANILRLQQENINLIEDAKNKAKGGNRDGALRILKRKKMNEIQIARLTAYNDILKQNLVSLLKDRNAAATAVPNIIRSPNAVGNVGCWGLSCFGRKSRKNRKNRKGRKTRSRR